MIGRIRSGARRARDLVAAAAGQMTIEWTLVLVTFALPMYFVLMLGMKVLVAQYQMLTFLETLPFP